MTVYKHMSGCSSLKTSTRASDLLTLIYILVGLINCRPFLLTTNENHSIEKIKSLEKKNPTVWNRMIVIKEIPIELFSRCLLEAIWLSVLKSQRTGLICRGVDDSTLIAHMVHKFTNLCKTSLTILIENVIYVYIYSYNIIDIYKSQCVVPCTHQTSVLEVNIPSRKLSGGIHLTGTIARPFFL